MSNPSPLPYRRRRYLVIACAIVWTAAFVVTHTPSEHLPRLHAKDVTLHLIGYFIIASLFLVTLYARGTSRHRRAALVFLIMLTYGALDEITQPLVNRSAAFFDWVADGIGTIAAILVCELLLAMSVMRRRLRARH